MNNSIVTFLLLFSFVSFASAQHEETHADVEFSYVGGRIEIEPGGEGFVFEGEFGEGAFANFASEPGIASELDEGAGVNAGNIIGFNVLDNLFYWSGSRFAPGGDATITISGVGGAADTIVSASNGVQLVSFAAPTNLLGQADAEGDFHVDPGFTISEGAPAGGYGLLLSLATNDPGEIADSEPFGIFLNFGLEQESFESGVEAFGAVPEPLSLMPVGFGLAALGLLRRRGISSVDHMGHFGGQR